MDEVGSWRIEIQRRKKKNLYISMNRVTASKPMCVYSSHLIGFSIKKKDKKKELFKKIRHDLANVFRVLKDVVLPLFVYR